MTGLKGNMNADQPWVTLLDAVGGTSNNTMPDYGKHEHRVISVTLELPAGFTVLPSQKIY
jgi:hypothetical protein